MSRPKRGGKRSGGVAKEDHYKAQKDKALRQLEQAQALLQVGAQRQASAVLHCTRETAGLGAFVQELPCSTGLYLYEAQTYSLEGAAHGQ